jgi:hypothetical protein
VFSTIVALDRPAQQPDVHIVNFVALVGFIDQLAAPQEVEVVDFN